MLDPVPVHLPLVQAEEESRLLASARTSQSLGHRGTRLLHFSFDHMIPALPLKRSASIVALVIIAFKLKFLLKKNCFCKKEAQSCLVKSLLTEAYSSASACTMTMSLSRTTAVRVAKRGSQEGKIPALSFVVIPHTQSSGVWEETLILISSFWIGGSPLHLRANGSDRLRSSLPAFR